MLIYFLLKQVCIILCFHFLIEFATYEMKKIVSFSVTNQKHHNNVHGKIHINQQITQFNTTFTF